MLFAAFLQGTNTPRLVAFGTDPIAQLSNQYREQAGLPDLITNSILTQSAQAKADDMAKNLYFAHESPSGRTPWSFFDDAGYIYQAAGENLALTNQDPKNVVDGWYNSIKHRENMLSETFTEVGYGVSYVDHFTYNDTDYNQVWLVAAHYALPVGAESAPIEVAGASTESTQPVTTTSEAQIPSPTPTANTSAPLTVSTTPTPPNTISYSAPTPIVSVGTTPNETSQTMVTLTVVLGGVLVVVGTAVELRRLIRHQRLLPRFHP